MPFLGLKAAFGLFALAEIAGVGIWAARSWKKVDTTTLSVTGQRFEATGDNLDSDLAGNYTRPGNLTVPASKVKSIQYVYGGEDSPTGLYVSSSYWKGGCFLPGLNRRQCTAVKCRRRQLNVIRRLLPR